MVLQLHADASLSPSFADEIQLTDFPVAALLSAQRTYQKANNGPGRDALNSISFVECRKDPVSRLGRLSKQSTDLRRLSYDTNNDAIINEITGSAQAESGRAIMRIYRS
jgi:hypothetical protein